LGLFKHCVDGHISVAVTGAGVNRITSGTVGSVGAGVRGIGIGITGALQTSIHS